MSGQSSTDLHTRASGSKSLFNRKLMAGTALALALSFAGSPRVQAADNTQLAPIAQTLMDMAVANGTANRIATAIGFRDGTTWNGGSGWRDIAGTQPVRATDQFRIGSQSKTYTGTVILQMVDQGAIRLTDTLQSWLPSLNVTNASQITIRNLLDMTAGVPEYLTAPSMRIPNQTILTEWNNLSSPNGP